MAGWLFVDVDVLCSRALLLALRNSFAPVVSSDRPWKNKRLHDRPASPGTQPPKPAMPTLDTALAASSAQSQQRMAH